MAMRSHYYLSIADLSDARGPVPSLSYDGAGPDDLAAALQEAMRTSSLFERWRAMQDEPDEVDASLGATDPSATVSAHVHDLRIDVDLITDLPMSIVRHRLNLLIGSSWQLRDMRKA
ncbi:hypothetical protein P5Y53_20090 [Dyella jiangningensis]|jgi:hypothetical protein|uniref:hypothetical protein n=1 Tax=Dyella jiangningensis TaxID=1379159 RepID=UPI000A58065F|nr:hypothetical protein [Dyella jiangningensis]MDG2539987.1 hypothetical protein [Dyella jiangningensis]